MIFKTHTLTFNGLSVKILPLFPDRFNPSPFTILEHSNAPISEQSHTRHSKVTAPLALKHSTTKRCGLALAGYPKGRSHGDKNRSQNSSAEKATRSTDSENTNLGGTAANTWLESKIAQGVCRNKGQKRLTQIVI